MDDQNQDTVLVACPTYIGLSDLLDAYVDAYDALKWPKRELLLVDNTADGGKYAQTLRDKALNVIHIEPSRSFQETFSRSWWEILRYANRKQIHWIFSVEQDVICPPLALDTLLNIACYVQAPFVTHTYPYHWGVKNLYQGLGCTLILRTLLQAAMEDVRTKNMLVEGAIYERAKPQSHVSLTGLLDVKHLDGHKRHWQFDDETDPRVMYPPEYAELDKAEADAKAAIDAMEPSVTVCIPCYNQAAFLGDAINSVLNQTYPVSEILIMDDGSTDEFKSVVAQFDDPRISVKRFKKNRGLTASINGLFSVSKGTHTVWLSADDVLEPTYVRCCLGEFANDKDLEFCSTQADFIDAIGKPHTDVSHPYHKTEMCRNRTQDEWKERLYIGGVTMGVGMYKTPVWKAIGGLKEEWGLINEYEVYLQLLKRHNLRVVEMPLTHTRLHEGQRSVITDEQWKDCEKLYQRARKEFYSGAMH